MSSRRVRRSSTTSQGQNFESIKSQCLQAGALWEDPEFPAENGSLYYSRAPKKPFEWKRPREICADAKFFVDGATRFDVKQGDLGDSWLVAALATLTNHQQLLHRVVPDDQSFDVDYAGVVHFKFWQYGEWVDVVIDDRLPCIENKLVFLHSPSKNEFWSALLEKAYAKLHGSYEALKGGTQAEAMEDFTGGLIERFDLRKAPDNLLTIMLKGHQRASLMGCALDVSRKNIAGAVREVKGPLGLITGHPYSITSVKMISIRTSRIQGAVPLVRVRNPWADESEWQGPWSDKSREWQLIGQSEREQLGLTFDDDGEFWMSFQDFCKYFSTLEICSLGPDTMGASAAGRPSYNEWESRQEHGRWVRRVSAGGSRQFIDTFWTNPQYRVTVTDPDDDDDDNLCTVIVGLMQKDRRKMKKLGLQLLTIGYYIYQLKEESGTGNMDIDFFKRNTSFAQSPSTLNVREMCGRHQLPPGSYLIVPYTFGPGEEADFLLRIFTEKAAEVGLSDEPSGYDESALAKPESPEDPAIVDRLHETFKKISGVDMEVDAYELKNILNAAYSAEFVFDGFSTETCRSIVGMLDYDNSGKIGFEEFRELWNKLRKWKGVFKKYDSDRSGYFNSYELRQALQAAGFRVSNGAFEVAVIRFSNKAGYIEFDDFVLLLTRLSSAYDTFSSHVDPAGRERKAAFSLDEFLQISISR